MFTCEVENVYIVEDHRLKKFRVIEFYPKTNVAILITPGGHRIRTSLDSDMAMYFKTPEEALRQAYNELQALEKSTKIPWLVTEQLES
jgi:hypothetical protein